MKKTCFIVLSLLLYLFLGTPCSSYGLTKKAFLIGINNYKNLPFYSKEFRKTITHLKGAVNDAQIMKEMLISQFGFRSEDVLMLLDSKATRDNILNGFKDWLINGTKEGDLAVFYFSGHGTQVPESVRGNEPDRLDEALCPYDVVPDGAGSIDEARLIIDDEIKSFLDKLNGRDVIFIADCCHARTITRGIKGVPVSKLELTPAYQTKFMPVGIKGFDKVWNIFSGNAPKKDYLSSNIPEGHIYFYSCRENQVSIEMPISGRDFGVFTKLFVEGIEQRKGNLTYRDLYAFVKKRIKDGYSLGLSQDPQIEPANGKIIERQVFSPASRDGKEPVEPTKHEGKPSELVAERSVSPLPPSSPSTLRSLPRSVVQSQSLTNREKALVRVETLEGESTNFLKMVQDRLRKIPYVEVVENESFDRLIRGKVKDSEFHVSVLNRVGDAEQIPPKNNIEDLIGAITPELEYAYNTKQLSRIRHRSPPFQVTISLPDEQRDFRIGESVVYTISCEADSYLLVLSLDSQGGFQLIHPDQYNSQSDLVKAGTNIQIQEQSPSAGEKTFKVIATSARLTFGKGNSANSSEEYQSIARSGMKESSEPKEQIKAILGLIERKSKQKDFRWNEDTVVLRIH